MKGEVLGLPIFVSSVIYENVVTLVGQYSAKKDLMHRNDRGHSLSPQTADARRLRSPSLSEATSFPGIM